MPGSVEPVVELDVEVVFSAEVHPVGDTFPTGGFTGVLAERATRSGGDEQNRLALLANVGPDAGSFTFIEAALEVYPAHLVVVVGCEGWSRCVAVGLSSRASKLGGRRVWASILPELFLQLEPGHDERPDSGEADQDRRTNLDDPPEAVVSAQRRWRDSWFRRAGSGHRFPSHCKTSVASGGGDRSRIATLLLVHVF